MVILTPQTTKLSHFGETGNKLRIAIIGSGISGLTAARALHPQHQVTLFEAGAHVGGHVNTLTVSLAGREYEVDTGFIVYNDRTYPHFSALLNDLDVATMPTSMSFSVRNDRTGLEYNGTNLNGVFAQRSNLVRPKFLRMLRDILRFFRQGAKDLLELTEDQTVGDYLRVKGYSRHFAEDYLLPMGAAIWSCPTRQFEQFPIRFILEFYHNHGLLSLSDRPQWRVITGGSRRYVDKMIQSFKDRILLNCPVRWVVREDYGVKVIHSGGVERFDEVIFACHSDQALNLLADADATETELLSAFPYSTSVAVLHTDTSVLPRNRRAWASWNYHVTNDDARPTLTYNMNMLQHIESEHTFCVTLNEEQHINPAKVLATVQYAHPVFTTDRARMQRRHPELIRRRRTSYCGAYWRNGFHEDGVASARAVCEAFSRVSAAGSYGKLVNSA